MHTRTIIGATALVFLSACAVQRAQQATDAKAQMIGMTKEQILSCAGIPTQKAAEGRVEVWSYASGNGHVDSAVNVTANSFGGFATGTATGVASKRFCIVNVAMEGGRVQRVSYLGPTGGILTEGEQCAYAVRNCIHGKAG